MSERAPFLSQAYGAYHHRGRPPAGHARADRRRPRPRDDAADGRAGHADGAGRQRDGCGSAVPELSAASTKRRYEPRQNAGLPDSGLCRPAGDAAGAGAQAFLRVAYLMAPPARWVDARPAPEPFPPRPIVLL